MDQDVPQSSVSYPLNNVYVRDITPGLTPIFGTYGDTGAANERVGGDGVVRDQRAGAAEQREVVERGQLVQLKQSADERQREFVGEFVDVREYLDGEHDVGDELLRDGAIAGQRDAGQRRGIFLGEIGDVHLRQRSSDGGVAGAGERDLFFPAWGLTALTISGTASEIPSGVQTVQVNIQNGGNYWSGTDNGSGSFGASLNYVTATFSNPGWTFTIPAAQWRWRRTS